MVKAAERAYIKTESRSGEASFDSAPDRPFDHQLIELGAEWAHRTEDRIRADGRPLSGGWPGTLSEARQIVATHARASSRAPSDLDRLSRLVYSSGRQTWLVRARHEERAKRTLRDE